MSDTPADFHKWAKDAGNRLRAYVLSYASGATAVFFLALTGKEIGSFTTWQKAALVIALLLYVATSVLSLLELHVDARRFFNIAKQLERPESERSWAANDSAKRLRLNLIYASYITAGAATVVVMLFLVMRIL